MRYGGHCGFAMGHTMNEAKPAFKRTGCSRRHQPECNLTLAPNHPGAGQKLPNRRVKENGQIGKRFPHVE
jgi:hypothetical protein